MNIEVVIKIKDEDGTSTGSAESSNYDNEGEIIHENKEELLAELIIRAIPSYHFKPFNVLEIFDDGKVIGHAEK